MTNPRPPPPPPLRGAPAQPIDRHWKHSNAAEEVMTEEQTEGQEKGSQAVQEALDRRDNGGPTGRTG
jgi:hypothetical protein